MILRGYGEDRLIAELTRRPELGAEVRVGPGDDCAVIGRPRDRRWQLLKTDVVVEGVHFLPDEDPRRVGWKALCRALSDIAAMGGVPRQALVTIAISPEAEVARVKALYAGLRRAARRFQVSIVGGEMSRSPGSLFINVALTGWVERTRCVLRSGGQPGDALYVTGRLGGSGARKHLDFTPRLAEARWLVSHFRLHAMMDLSDGLAADLPRLAAASHCGFTMDEARIPRTRGCTLRQALGDGEDFELLFALPAHRASKLEAAWQNSFPKLPLTRIGTLCAYQPSTINYQPTGGFDHFAQS
ncbi:MAG: thiamine-monophosphate kinase [Chthoniobacter sp.]|jgi:thiamine-monophosphate kinase|nr:thiamine-monophosphate kinase [Chthoniobacter sp.]